MPASECVSGLAAAALDLLPQSLYIVDRDMTVVAWNAGREQGPLGLARVRALGHNLRDVLSPRGFDSVLPALRQVLDTGRAYEEKRTSKDGRRTYRVRRMPITGNGAVTHVVTMSVEIPRTSACGASAAAVAPRGLSAVRTTIRGLLRRRPSGPAVIPAPPRDLALNEIIPVCAWCKKIRDQHGDWHQVEAYLASRSDASFTHGICQDCSGRAHLAAAAETRRPRGSVPGRVAP